MSLLLRAVESDEDYVASLELRNRLLPFEAITLDFARLMDRLRPADRPFQRYGVWDGDEAVARAFLTQEDLTGTKDVYFLSVLAVQDDRAPVVEAMAFEHLEREARALGADEATVITHEDWVAQRAVLEERGYAAGMRFQTSKIELEGRSWEVTGPTGVTVTTMGEMLARDGEAGLRRVYEGVLEIEADIPGPDDDYAAMPWGEYRERVLATPWFHETVLLAYERDAFLGMSELKRNEVHPEWAATGLTGVVRAVRRRGIARYLKVLALRRAQALGVKTVWTDNEENNPMLRLNGELGFAPWFVWIAYKKELGCGS